MRAITYWKVSNMETGFKELLEWFRSSKIRLSTIAIGMDHTGAYGYDLIDYNCFMSLALKHSMGFVRGKNDKVDAERIADRTYMQRDKLVYSKLSGSVIQKLRGLSGERKCLVRQCAKHEVILTECQVGDRPIINIPDCRREQRPATRGSLTSEK